METAPTPLALALSPLLPIRAPDFGTTTLTLGLQLRLPDGPAIAPEDPLLAAFGATVVDLVADPDDREALQDAAFAPGRPLALIREGVDEDGDPAVGAWDAGGTRRAGSLPYRAAGMAAAALEQGLGVVALALAEHRLRADDRRVGLSLLVHAPALVRVHGLPETEPAPARRRSRPPRRRRLVLVADGLSDPRWWDPSGRGGPLDLDDLPLSGGLVDDLRSLSAEYARVAGGDAPADALDAIERDGYRSALDHRLRQLWSRARDELGRRYAVGLLGPGMARPAWSPDDPSDDADADIPF
jgi:hypothetical protein